MYYIFATLVVGAFIGGSALLNQPHIAIRQSSLDRLALPRQNQDSPTIVDNEALSAESTQSLNF
jgi:hypothetical protein